MSLTKSKRACPLLFLLFCSWCLFLNLRPFQLDFIPYFFPTQLSAFSLCSSCLIYAFLVLSTIYLFMKVSLIPDIILCVWLGLKHQLTSKPSSYVDTKGNSFGCISHSGQTTSHKQNLIRRAVYGTDSKSCHTIGTWPCESSMPPSPGQVITPVFHSAVNPNGIGQLKLVFQHAGSHDIESTPDNWNCACLVAHVTEV